MHYCRYAIVLLVSIGLTACSKSGQSLDENYLTSTTTAPGLTVPAGSQAPKQSPYYRVPTTNTQGETPPSIKPPATGSTAAQQRVSTQSSTTKRATLILDSSTAWDELGAAIAKDPNLKVVDSDYAAKTYYVLDTQKTSGAIKKKTPAYRVILKPIKTGSLVTVTNDKGDATNIDTYNTIINNIKKYLGS